MKRGDRVTYTPEEDASLHQGRVNWGGNDDPDTYLEPGRVYTVSAVDVRAFHTKVQLKGVPGRWFNDTHFEEAQHAA